MHQSPNCRAGIFAAGKIEGDVRINGHPKEQETFARVSGYVEQFDTHTAAATVYEALVFSGTLRNGREVDIATTKTFIDQACSQIFPKPQLGLTVQIIQNACNLRHSPTAAMKDSSACCAKKRHNHLIDFVICTSVL